MDEVLDTVLKDLRSSIEESGARIEHDTLPMIIGDRTQIILVLENLVSNAIKFRGEEAPQIHLSVRSTGKEWVISVQDNGIGVDPSQKDRLFKMFERLHPREEYPGTGIGLAIAKKITDRHGGKIWFESEPGVGSTFYPYDTDQKNEPSG